MAIRLAPKDRPRELEALLDVLPTATSFSEALARSVQALAALPGVARARAWCPAAGDVCASCDQRPHCPDRTTCLHLTASAGVSRTGADWSRVDEDERRIPMGHGAVGLVGATGKARHLPRLTPDTPGVADPETLRREGLRGFTAQPVRDAEGHLRAVLAVAARVALDPTALAWLHAVTRELARLHPLWTKLESADAASWAAHTRLAALEPDPEAEPVVAKSDAMARVLDQVALAAPISQPVLLHGESGVGKTLVARVIHDQGARAASPFLVCPASALNSPAEDPRLRAIAGGTLVVQHLDQLPPSAHADLLETATRLGVRLLATTRRDPATLRATLGPRLHRSLTVFPIRVPPLRERAGDVSALLHRFTDEFAHLAGVDPPRPSAAQLDRLRRDAWPGNVRELREFVRLAVCAVEAGQRPRFARGATGPASDPDLLTAKDLRRLETENLRLALERAGGKVSGPGGAAELLGVKPTTLASRLKALGVSRGRRS